jgi:hypothetical protein
MLFFAPPTNPNPNPKKDFEGQLEHLDVINCMLLYPSGLMVLLYLTLRVSFSLDGNGFGIVAVAQICLGSGH